MSVDFDYHREERTGIPEVIIADSKQNKDLRTSVLEAIKGQNKILVTRVNTSQIEIIEEIVEFEDLIASWDDYQRTVLISLNGVENQADTQVIIIAAGTSDLPVVEEIKKSLDAFEIGYEAIIDVGVAGIHRHQKALKRIENSKSIKIAIVVAGAEGALFSVVAAQTKLPVLAVPVSTGYGFGGNGETAIRSALQSCAPGIATVNIDNGFGAASFVAKLLKSI